MEEDMVPAGLMDAFAADGRGRYRVRHAFGQDAAAVAVAIGLALIYLLLIVGVVVLIVGLFGDDPDAGAMALTAGGS